MAMPSIIGALREDLATLREVGAVEQEVLQAFDALAVSATPADCRITDTTIPARADERPEKTRP